jgi:hypothetical protein
VIVPHCWIGNSEVVEWGSDAWAEAFNNPATCMLLDGHEGPHEFVPDSEIVVSFEDKP